MSGVRLDPSASPMLSGALTEWFPTLGESWQRVHVPWMTGTLSLSFKPPTPVTRIGLVLKSASPRATEARRAFWAELPRAFDHELNSVIDSGLKGAPVGLP